MSQTLAFLATAVATAVLFLLLDWIIWGTKWAHANVCSKVPKEMWRGTIDVQGKFTGNPYFWMSPFVSAWSALVFVPMVWMLGPQFANARAVLLAVLLWAIFDLPGALYCGIFYRLPASYLKLQALGGFLRVVLGLVLVSWMLAMFRVW